MDYFSTVYIYQNDGGTTIATFLKSMTDLGEISACKHVGLGVIDAQIPPKKHPKHLNIICDCSKHIWGHSK